MFQRMPRRNTSSNGKPRTASQHLILFIGSLAYLGFVPFASGTVAVAVVGVPLHVLLIKVCKLEWLHYGLFAAAFTLISIWVAGRTDRILNEKDSKRNVIDEIPGYLVAVVGLPLTWQVVVAAFFIERTIDIIKIWPATWIERRMPGGWGVVLDDIVAGLYTLGILHLGYYLRPHWFGAFP